MYVEGPGRWRWVRVGNFERQSVGEEARSTVQTKLASREPFCVDFKVAEPPPAGGDSSEVESELVFEISILNLKMLGVQEDALGPKDALHLSHLPLT